MTSHPAEAQFLCGEAGTYPVVAGNVTVPTGSGSAASGIGSVTCGFNAGSAVVGNLNNSAFGNFAGGNANGGANSAFGVQAGLSARGDGNSAFGVASGLVDGDNNTAMGSHAGSGVLGDNNVAVGLNAGSSTTPGTSLEITNTVAVGSNAIARADGATALGTGAEATRVNQMAFGTAVNTYTAAGIASAASKSAQGAPTHLVTSNSGGDLAAYTFAELGLASSGDVSTLQTQINRLGRRDKELAEGIATIASLAQPILRDGQHFGMTAGWGGFDDANAIGFSAAGVLADNLLGPGHGTLALYGGVGVGTSEGEAAGRAGMSFGW